MPEKAAVVFDLGNVLLSFDYQRAACALAKQSSVSEKQLRELIDQSPLLLKYEAGGLTTPEFFDHVKSNALYTGSLEDFRPLFGDIFSEIPEMIKLNDRLRATRHRTYIFSNTNELAVDFIRDRFPFFSKFDRQILSFEHHCMKPEPGIYEVVEQVTGRKGAGIIYIDDREENITSAKSRGWRTIHHRDPQTTISIVDRLTEV